MPVINITITNKVAKVQDTPVIVCGNSDYSILFAFDEEWAEYGTKTARFAFCRYGAAKYIDQIFTGNTVAVPVLSGIDRVIVGVFAGDLHTTTPAQIYCERSILCETGAPEEPPEDVYNQIMELLAAGGVGGVAGAQSWEDLGESDDGEIIPLPEEYLPESVGEHLKDVNNPHGVTPAQIGAATTAQVQTAQTAANNAATAAANAQTAADNAGAAAANAQTAADNAGAAAANAQTAADNAATAAANAQTTANTKAPAYTYGTDDMTAGESELATGTLYFVYE